MFLVHWSLDLNQDLDHRPHHFRALRLKLGLTSLALKTWSWDWNYITHFPGPPACRWQIVGFHNFHNCISQFFVINLLRYISLTRVTVHWRKWNNHFHYFTTGHWLWTDTNSRRPKTSLWSTSQNRGLYRLGGQLSFNSDPSQKGHSGSPNLFCGYFSSPQEWNLNGHTYHLAEFSHSMTYYVKVNMVRKATKKSLKMSPIVVSLSAKIANQTHLKRNFENSHNSNI